MIRELLTDKHHRCGVQILNLQRNSPSESVVPCFIIDIVRMDGSNNIDSIGIFKGVLHKSSKVNWVSSPISEGTLPERALLAIEIEN